MSLYEGRKTRVRVDSVLSVEEFEVEVGMHQGSVLSPFFAVVVDVVTEFMKEGVISELLYADDLVLMSDTIKGLRSKFMKWKKASESINGMLSLGRPR